MRRGLELIPDATSATAPTGEELTWSRRSRRRRSRSRSMASPIATATTPPASSPCSSSTPGAARTALRPLRAARRQLRAARRRRRRRSTVSTGSDRPAEAPEPGSRCIRTRRRRPSRSCRRPRRLPASAGGVWRAPGAALRTGALRCGMASERTLVFADLAGYTALTEAHGDEDAAQVATRFHRLARAALPAGTTLVKTIGDAPRRHGVPHGRTSGTSSCSTSCASVSDQAKGSSRISVSRPDAYGASKISRSAAVRWYSIALARHLVRPASSSASRWHSSLAHACSPCAGTACLTAAPARRCRPSGADASGASACAPRSRPAARGRTGRRSR